VALESGAFVMMNDVLPEGTGQLVLRETETGRMLVAERPPDWTNEEEAEYLADMRRKFLGKPE
jgi:hypothetical protein